MTVPVVCDASALVALLVDDGPDGRWAAQALSGSRLAAPHLLPYEATNILRRLVLSERLGADLAAQAHHDLCDLAIDLWPYELVGGRVWELRANLTAYDASYVAVAEAAGAALVTLDRGIAGAPGVRCDVLVP